MTLDQENSFMDVHGLKGPVQDFAQFCALELERRRNSEPEFDETLYQDAVKLILTKLNALVPEGLS